MKKTENNVGNKETNKNFEADAYKRIFLSQAFPPPSNQEKTKLRGLITETPYPRQKVPIQEDEDKPKGHQPTPKVDT